MSSEGGRAFSLPLFLCLLLKAYAICCTSSASGNSEGSHDSAHQEAPGDCKAVLSDSDLSKLESAFEQLLYLVGDLDHAKGTYVWEMFVPWAII